MDLKIVSVDSDGTMAFNLKEQRLINGIQQLLQEVSVELLSNYNEVTGRGSSLPELLDAAAPGDVEATSSAIASAINTAQAHITENQSDSDLDASERLQQLLLVGAHSDSGIEWDIEVEVTSEAGETAQTTVTL
jgi:hypothetical protein